MGSPEMMALLIAGIALVGIFCLINYALDQVEQALDEAFNGDRHE